MATNNANANTFVNTQKCDILKSKMGINFLQYQQMIPIQVEVLGRTSSWTKYVFPEPNPTSSQLSGSYFSRFEKLNSKIVSLEAQLAESMQLPENVVNSNNASIFDSYINQELEKRLGVIEINLAKLTKLVREDTIDTKSAQCSEFSNYNNGGLEKKLERIEAHLVKFARKDIRGPKHLSINAQSPYLLEDWKKN
ncbi:hypothetical protein C1645_731015 [Glomus cerebriforme]|uniref:Uncharacterized protein n=1 Tax=Glomus cerebriforme TaxID=658196 RepID=A0A397TWH7_9GLOM|nr:hypothetical protein C1645_731015 [Glomus cerebriforme]